MTLRHDVVRYSASIDHALQFGMGKLTRGVSPAAMLLAFTDWYAHLAMHPAKQIQLIDLYQNYHGHLTRQLLTCLGGSNNNGRVAAHVYMQDKRFTDEDWSKFPYAFYCTAFLMAQSWWHTATTGVHGVNQHHQDVVDFVTRQILDMLSPANSLLTNPEIQRATVAQQGENLIQGLGNWIEDFKRMQADEPPVGAEQFIVGKNVAVTPGKVIYKNQLMELIQYEPQTETVYREPILITPAWIMKYYILDLTPKHSLVRYLVKRGHTVFMISWKNPTKKDREMGMEDYLKLGILDSLNVIASVLPKQKVHLVGYCLGGTLSAIAAATLARDNKHRLATMTLFAAQVDFTEPGELGLFIDESQISFLENMMLEKGYLDTHQMTSTFQLIRSNDLIWSRLIHDYLLGLRKPLTDLMAWNADTTRLPYKMHSEYLRNLFLNNQLAEGHYLVSGKPIALSDISVPIFVVSTERDHVSPWHSVFKINLLTTTNITFLLTSGGHNVGIVNMPTKKTKRYYRVSACKESDHYIDPESWYQRTKPLNGSWWPVFEKWITTHSHKKKVAPPSIGAPEKGYAPLSEAPGTYVLQK